MLLWIKWHSAVIPKIPFPDSFHTMLVVERLCKIVKVPFLLKTNLKFSKRPRIRYEAYPLESYEIGARLDRYLKRYSLGGWSAIQMLLRNKDIMIETRQGQVMNSNSYIFQEGDSILINQNLKHLITGRSGIPGDTQERPHHQIDFSQAKETLDGMVLFDNPNIIVLNKTAGYSVQGGANFDKNIFSLMIARYRKQYIHISHRLDKPTSGILFFAKNLKAAQLIQTGMEQRSQFSKFYLAMAEGPRLNQKQGYLRSNIEWTKKRVARVCSEGKEDSKDAITFYKLLKEQLIQNKHSEAEERLLNIIGMKILTGRKHQIRCHLTHFLHNTILNDIRYQAKPNDAFSESEIALHSFKAVIEDQQIIKKVFAMSSSEVEYENSQGSLKLQNNKLTIIANLPSNWSKVCQVDLKKLEQGLEESEKQSRSTLKPAKRVIKIE